MKRYPRPTLQLTVLMLLTMGTMALLGCGAFGQGQDLPTPRWGMGVAASNGRIFLMGGVDRHGHRLSTVEAYDPRTNRWQRRAAMPTPRNLLATAVAPDGRIYAVGGVCECNKTCRSLDTVEVYDPGQDAWTPRASLPAGRHSLILAATPNGHLFAMGGVSWHKADEDNPGGCASDYPLPDVDEYDPVTDTWTPRSGTRPEIISQ